MLRTALMLALLAGCARGLVDENEGSIKSDEPPSAARERPPARRVAADAPAPLPPRAPSVSFVDPEGDVTTKDAADIVRVSAAEDADHMLEIVVETKGFGDIDLYIDSDLHDATGVSGFDVRASGSAASGEVLLWFQEGGTWRAVDVPTLRASFANGKLVIHIHRQYLGPEGSRGPIGIAAGTEEDLAPDGAPEERYVFRPL